MTKSFLLALSLAGLSFLLVACGGGGESDEETQKLVIKQLNHDVRTPANITVAFKVETNKGEPVPGLQTGDFSNDGTENDNFEIWENGSKISQDESLAKIDPDTGDFDYYIYLLLDLSQSILNNSLEETKEGAVTLVEDLFSKGFRTDNLKIKIGYFDGSQDIKVIQGFSNDKELLIDEINKISEDTSNDPSTNLYGSVINAITELNTTITDSQNAEEKYIVAGSLVVFTDGTDQAARNTFAEAQKAVSSAHANAKIFTIGLGGEVNEDILDAIGKDGYKQSDDAAGLSATFGEIADLIVKETESYYVLRYCTPKRAGTNNQLKLIAKKDGLQGETTLTFSAENFGSGCIIE